ncbi:HEPN domain-containing protein [Sphingobacterium sp. UT-1RO-CII-1]|uniref:HEPN domain-containing protein n=1 Tax=Sphingobacterium sp. UT-1RO-CII-1 TaxID=2995225 RepID=UPI00227C854D|nr:HEPN domain-containing protein [Sphingobacterium sp. UT-1RO-CII-1]MCY4778930.1 HEPN domain-containing protein [Sphingobacterium sp. UT-1RO-CII-1]
MQSFRTELENPVVAREIIELEHKINAYRQGSIGDDKFRSLRLARGIYGQRQPGVQMIRIKLPFGKVTFQQLLKIADVSDEYASRNLHLTTRQDVQIHFVSLDKTPELWAKLAEDDMTLREACGNTVRNVTASPEAGIDPNEPFDVSPYAQNTFEYFVRNPICAEMGRKIKIAFSSSESDTAFSYIHDFGFVPKIEFVDGKEQRGFKVMLGGGLGAQPLLAQPIYNFLHEDEIIPLMEAALRVFDRHGERNNRNKARFKFLIQKLGLEEVLSLIEEERTALKNTVYKIDRTLVEEPQAPTSYIEPTKPQDGPGYELWKRTNVMPQKQSGYYAVYAKIPTGDISTDKTRKLVAGLKNHIADDIRITQGQNLLFKFVRQESLPHIYNVLYELGFHHAGIDSTADITTCPGTDTCNLGISNSTEMARVLEKYIEEFHPDQLLENKLKIKISGCMNSCGQHSLAEIGFHGSSMKVGDRILPTAQVMLGGGTVGNGVGRASERVIKVPTKRVLQVVDLILIDYKTNRLSDESFHDYYDRSEKRHFYDLLKPLADTSNLTDDEFIDWGHQDSFTTAIGVGECAGVIIDLVATLLLEAEEKLEWANLALKQGLYADAIYHAYSAFVWTAKALLLDKGVNASTQISVINEFQKHYVETAQFAFPTSFPERVLQINKYQPSAEFAKAFITQAAAFYYESNDRREELRQSFKETQV